MSGGGSAKICGMWATMWEQIQRAKQEKDEKGEKGEMHIVLLEFAKTNWSHWIYFQFWFKFFLIPKTVSSLVVTYFKDIVMNSAHQDLTSGWQLLKVWIKIGCSTSPPWRGWMNLWRAHEWRSLPLKRMKGLFTPTKEFKETQPSSLLEKKSSTKCGFISSPYTNGWYGHRQQIKNSLIRPVGWMKQYWSHKPGLYERLHCSCHFSLLAWVKNRRKQDWS